MFVQYNFVTVHKSKYFDNFFVQRDTDNNLVFKLILIYLYLVLSRNLQNFTLSKRYTCKCVRSAAGLKKSIFIHF